MGEVTSEQKEDLKVILRSCERLEHDLEMVLQHMRIDLAERLSPKAFDIAEVVKKTQEALKSEADKKNISLRFHGPDEAVPVEADRFIMEKAIFNLIDNAVRYTDEGGQVEVRLSVNDDLLEFQVADNGKGIEKEKLDLLLQPFEEVITVRDRELRGLGLGLSNVKRYTELHGGLFEAESTPGEGSTFTMRIPRHYEEGADRT
jgi:signal transduction histidine kinase